MKEVRSVGKRRKMRGGGVGGMGGEETSNAGEKHFFVQLSRRKRFKPSVRNYHGKLHAKISNRTYEKQSNQGKFPGREN